MITQSFGRRQYVFTVGGRTLTFASEHDLFAYLRSINATAVSVTVNAQRESADVPTADPSGPPWHATR